MVTKLDEKVTILCTVDGRLDYQPLFGKGAENRKTAINFIQNRK